VAVDRKGQPLGFLLYYGEWEIHTMFTMTPGKGQHLFVKLLREVRRRKEAAGLAPGYNFYAILPYNVNMMQWYEEAVKLANETDE